MLSEHAARRVRERGIEIRWIRTALTDPDRNVPDVLDPTARHALKRIPEMEDRVLRVIYNAETQPLRVISAYFDRRLKGGA